MKSISNQDGFTYILALTIVVIMGIMLGMIGQSWKTITQRELEDEMIFRGDQVAELVYQSLLCKNSAIQANTGNNSLSGANLTNTATQFLWLVSSANGTVLNDLVNGKEETCTSGTKKKFKLRVSASLDPLTNKPWHILNPVGDTVHFSGVASESKDEPLRKSFKGIYDSNRLDYSPTYSDWLFTWELKLPEIQNQALIQNLKK